MDILVQTTATSSKPAALPLNYNNWLHPDYFVINQVANRYTAHPLNSEYEDDTTIQRTYKRPRSLHLLEQYTNNGVTYYRSGNSKTYHPSTWLLWKDREQTENPTPIFSWAVFLKLAQYTMFIQILNPYAASMVSPPYRGGGFECSRDHESYAGGSVATGRVTHAGQVKG
jgi:hypothetical protein